MNTNTLPSPHMRDIINVTISVEELQRNYMESVTNILIDSYQDKDTDLDILLEDAKKLFISNEHEFITSLKRMFYSGSSMMLLGNKFDIVEDSYDEGLDFIIHVRSNDRLVCALVTSEVNW